MFTGLKALIDPGSASFLGLLSVAVATTVIGKLIRTGLPARIFGFSCPDSLSLGAMMQTKGLMEVVVLSVLHDAGLIGGQIFSSMVANGGDLHGGDIPHRSCRRVAWGSVRGRHFAQSGRRILVLCRCRRIEVVVAPP
jgi:hypothetical protein